MLTVEFLSACGTGCLERVRELAQKLDDIDTTGDSDKTGLMIAASRNHTAIMSFLLDRGADPNKVNRNGTTPLMFAKTAAFTYGDCTGMEILLEAGADRNVRDNKGMTALEYTIRNGQLVRGVLERY